MESSSIPTEMAQIRRILLFSNIKKDGTDDYNIDRG